MRSHSSTKLFCVVLFCFILFFFNYQFIRDASKKEIYKKCKENGYDLSYSAFGLYFWPRNWNTREGKRHIYAKQTKLKLAKAQTTARKKHPAHQHCYTLRQDAKKIASTLGSSALYMTMDNKAKVPVGVNCATKQTPIMMQMRNEVRLHDHSFVVGPHHKLDPNVYLVSKVERNKIDDASAVKCVGNVYVAVRSVAHNPTTPQSHHYDINCMIKGRTDVAAEMKESFYGDDGKIIPCWIIGNDGGKDLNSYIIHTW